MPSAPKFQAPQGQPLFDVQFRAISESLAGNGVLSTSDLEVTAGTGALEIDVASGTAYYVATEHTFGGASPAATLSGGDGTNDRWDTVAFDTATDSVTVREGTAEQYPTPPDIQGDEILLAIVYVASGATDIDNTNILNWRAKFSNEAEEVHYDDGTGVYTVDNVDAALDELQEAAQIGAYPLGIGDLASPFALPSITDMDAAGNDLVDGSTTVWDTSAGEVPQAQLGGPAASLSAYPLANSDLAKSALDVGAGTGLTTTSTTISLGGSATLAVDQAFAPSWTGEHSWDLYQVWQEQTTPSGSPATGYWRIYLKSDGNLYVQDDGGTESQVGGTADTRTNVSDDGSQVVADVTDIDFTTNLTVTDDGDGSVTVEASGGGGSSWAQTTQTADYTASDNDSVWADASANTVTVTLPAPSQNAHVRVVAIDATNAVTLSENGTEGINDQSGSQSTITMNEGESIEVESDGNTWWIV